MHAQSCLSVHLFDRSFSHTIIYLIESQNVDGVNFLSVKKNGLYYVGTTKFNVSPSLVIELLGRLTRVFKVSAMSRYIIFFCVGSCEGPNVMCSAGEDPTQTCFRPQDYCGVLTEEAIRKNFVLIYELLDECMVIDLL